MPGLLRVSSTDSFVDGKALLDHSLVMDNTLGSIVEPPVMGNSLGLGGGDSDKESSWLVIGMGQSIKETVIGSHAKMGAACYLGVQFLLIRMGRMCVVRI